MVDLLEEYELFKDVAANITLPGGEKIGFGNLMMVDEAAMMKLEDEKILKLVKSGALAWIYAHLVSISNFRDLMNHAAKAGAPEAAAEGDDAEVEGKSADSPTFGDLMEGESKED